MVKYGHLENIDFIKGLATISVILLHTLPRNILYYSLAVYHIWQAVPIFLFITFFLSFRNFESKTVTFKEYYSNDKIKKIFIKLWLPLIILAVFETVFFIIIGNKSKAIGSLLCIGNGPGSYYIWCYMQIWLLIPFIYLILKRFNIVAGGGILLITSVLCDFIYGKYIGYFHGYTCFRYIFLSVPAFMCLKGFKIKETIFFILLSVVYLPLILYNKVPTCVYFILPNGWECQTSFGFFYTLLLFGLLSKCYDKIKKRKIAKYITYIGTISWEVFLVQMVLIGSGAVNFVSAKLFQSTYLQISFNIVVILSISLLLVELYKRLMSAIIYYYKLTQE